MKLRVSNPPASYHNILSRISSEDIIARIWTRDHTVWASDPKEIANRLRWLDLPTTMASQTQRISGFVDSVLKDGFSHAVLLGMGGSSLAPDMLSQTFGTTAGYLSLQILDSTHPVAIQRMVDDIPISKTLFIVSTKSGTTSETLSLFRTFYQRAVESVGSDSAGDHFIAITDPHSPLIEIATEHSFRDIFLNDPNLGGRYSALSLYGLIPAALLGLDIHALLHEARNVAEQCAPERQISSNAAAQLGDFLGACALDSRDKATLLLSSRITPLGDWIEQLIAESTGKDGKGIVPVLEPLPTGAEFYGKDRAFIAIRLGGDPQQDAIVREWIEQGHPVAQIEIDTLSELAGQFYLWEFATAVACHILGVHPFNQPNVESAKQLARNMIDESLRTGRLPILASEPLNDDQISKFLEAVAPGDYIAIHAYLPPSRVLTETLHQLQASIRDRYKVAVTFGYGPRFLHSTGQLHKGDRGNGHFIQLVSETMPPVAIPDGAGLPGSSLSFGTLITAQAFGDRQALENGGRPVLTLKTQGGHVL